MRCCAWPVPLRKMTDMGPIYLDNNATTPQLPEVVEAMRPYFADVYGNAASAHGFGRRARQALEGARDRLAAQLDAHADEVLFTSGATEANNLALYSLVGEPPARILASPIEHPSVAEVVRRLTRLGFAVDWLPVDATGAVQPEVFNSCLRPGTRLAAVQLANHETGTLQPVRDLVQRLTRHSLLATFHCDATQAVGKLPVRFHDLGVTTLSFSAHKFHGPKGVGALLVRRGVRLRPLFWGGHQQQGYRPGTEPVALVVGMVAALELAEREAAQRRERVLRLRGVLLERLRKEAAPLAINGPSAGGVPHTLNVSFPGCASDALLMNLDLAGVACSTGSACSSGSLLPSPVLQALGVAPEILDSALRFSLSALLTEAGVEEAARRIVTVVRRLRRSADDAARGG